MAFSQDDLVIFSFFLGERLDRCPDVHDQLQSPNLFDLESTLSPKFIDLNFSAKFRFFLFK